MSPKILRMRFFLLEMVAPTDVPVASDFFAMEGGASSLCLPEILPGWKFRALCGAAPLGTPKTPQAHQVPSGTGAAALATFRADGPPLPSVVGPRTWARLARSGRTEGAYREED